MSLILMYVMSSMLTFVFSFMFILSFKPLNNINKLMPFECGFNPMNSPRSPFSLQFFLITILFLIFDIEIIIILPFPLSFLKTYMFLTSSFFIILLLMMGLFFEWYMGSLSWN